MIDKSKWSTIIIQLSFWWKLKSLFRRKTKIIVCWGEDRFLTRGVEGEWIFSAGGVPNNIEKELNEKRDIL